MIRVKDLRKHTINSLHRVKREMTTKYKKVMSLFTTSCSCRFAPVEQARSLPLNLRIFGANGKNTNKQ